MPLFTIKSANGDEKSVIQIRALLATLFSLAVIGGFFIDKISQDTFLPIAIMAISWYFSKRDAEDKQKDNSNKGGVNGSNPIV